MTRCAHGIPDETGCDECEESELITWAEELQREPESLSRSWEMRVLGAVIVASFALGGWALVQLF